KYRGGEHTHLQCADAADDEHVRDRHGAAARPGRAVLRHRAGGGSRGRPEGVRHAQRSGAAARERVAPLRPVQLRGRRRPRAIEPTTWKNGHAFDPPAGSKIWNPVKLKMMRGEKVTGGTLFSATDPATYCAMANSGYDFIWTEMQHNDRDWEAVARMWRTCPYAKAVPGVRVAYTDEREIQHALDAGALVAVVPTVDSTQE